MSRWHKNKQSAVTSVSNTDNFSQAVLNWFAVNGRKDLPWQQKTGAYSIWISEIMLQQTQVDTVIPYFRRFMQQFPDVNSLANAPLDSVLQHWSGLGYYARARNLHRAAQVLCEQHEGQLPQNLEALCALPGIGRSTAGAILALAFEQRQSILDGNVKRVLCRYYAISQWSGQSAVTKQLWELADKHTPMQQVAAYTQAMMDMGATVCSRSRPHCDLCPLATGCQALAQDIIKNCPAPKPRKPLPERQTRMLMLQTLGSGDILLSQREQQGIWGGLWSFPECPAEQTAEHWCAQHLGITINKPDKKHYWPVRQHCFTHFRLNIEPVHILLDATESQKITDLLVTQGNSLWYHPQQEAHFGLAAPVAKLIQQLK
ncbi:A/G-specific adenine glycosylase [Candidatus Venteria ishoeyi]|uniref:Adenine DNA glycosylase n=1 Tax=Candidatus Venteria ishoeyi TaxID=1899563 RepID=A0A1H6FFF2_9GAMM|nr:A/G-specific adenine glycosylase [Candidatus Venteria ishoeyi]SEH08808.1 A/G-specific adenine glycosylase [Candidatus Venteria ishoeyi]